MRDPETAYREAMDAHEALDHVLTCLGEDKEYDADRHAMKRAMRDTYTVAEKAYEEIEELPFHPDPREDAFDLEWDPRDDVPAGERFARGES